MSVSRNTADELCNFILNKPSNVLGNKFFGCRCAINGDLSFKADKFEPRLLVISKFRVFIISGRSPASLKIEKNFHLLSIRGIGISTQDEVIHTQNNEIHIFEWKNRQWANIHTLIEHDLFVTGLDWAPNTNRIVSCSQDRNAFVWTLERGTWKPELVLIRFQRAATCVKWSPLENKFAVGSGSKLVSVCFYEKENDWWVSKQIKKPIRSTVRCLDWHPNNVLLAVGACDFQTRVFCVYIKEVDEKPSPNPWASKFVFNDLLHEYRTAGWIRGIGFSPSGCRLAWVSHDSSISFVDANVDIINAHTLRTAFLPFTSVTWITENSLIAAGHDCYPLLYTVANGQLKMVCKLDVPSAQKSSAVNSALQMFKNIDRMDASERSDLQLKTLHQNMICQIQPHSGNAWNVVKFSTCGTDGLIVLWNLKNNTAFAH